jgi:hypothetical protein
MSDGTSKIVDATSLRLEAFENGETGWAAVEQQRTLPNGETHIPHDHGLAA